MTGHASILHDLSMNATGSRMATCSTDRDIKIWDLDTSSGAAKYTLSGNITNAHAASAMKLSWACGTYGQIFASCALDNVLRIWQETCSPSAHGEEKVWRGMVS